MNDNLLNCKHEHIVPEICDQTLGIICNDCNAFIYYCWGNNHIPESVYNKAINLLSSEKDDWALCEQNSDTTCAFCGNEFG